MYAVIMAGGIGSRFWPRSRQKRPKQLLSIIGDRSLIQNTINRLDSLIKPEHIYIVSTAPQIEEIKRQLPFLTNQNLIIEPKGKNTAPCIGLAALFIRRLDPDAVMVVLPADHDIREEQLLRKVLSAAKEVAMQENRLVTIGIHPTYPSTGYGYIQLDTKIREINGIPVHEVKTFAEKPDIKTAERFIKSGDFLWNSGMFVWKAESILNEIEETLPDLYDGLLEIESALGTDSQNEVISRVYCRIKSISIDYGVMEHTKNVCVLKGDFGWSDVGSWEEVYKISKKDKNQNVYKGTCFSIDSHRCFIDVPDKLVAILGADDLIVVDSGDALLICRRDEAQKVKDVVDMMKRKELTNFL